MNKENRTVEEMCPPGKFSTGDTDNCTACDAGKFAQISGAIFCDSSSPGWFVNATKNRTNEDKCPPGKFSTGDTDECTACNAGRFAQNSGATACNKATPGNFVDTVEATTQIPCNAGHYSGNEAQRCNKCEQGKYQPEQGQAACLPCPHPLSTAHTGSLYCDACVVRYFTYLERHVSVVCRRLPTTGIQ